MPLLPPNISNAAVNHTSHKARHHAMLLSSSLLVAKPSVLLAMQAVKTLDVEVRYPFKNGAKLFLALSQNISCTNPTQAFLSLLIKRSGLQEWMLFVIKK